MLIIGSTPVTFPVPKLELAALHASLWLFKVWPYNSLKYLMAGYTAITPEVQVYALDAMNQINKPTFIAIWKIVTGAINKAGYPGKQIAVPLLLTHGEDDVTGTIRLNMPRWAEYESHASYSVIPKAGHNANQDNLEFFNELMSNFLNQ
jgi:3-oxoadipate enol-lactonase